MTLSSNSRPILKVLGSSKAINQPLRRTLATDRIQTILAQVVDAKPRTPPKPSPEEAERRYKVGRQYVIGRFHQHNQVRHDLACKLKLKKWAIKMLPKASDKEYGYLREAAMEINMEQDGMVPFWREIPTDTPPIKDFDVTKYTDTEKE